MTNPLPYGITLLRESCVLVADADTAFNGVYDPFVSTLHNHCGPVSYVVQKVYGGEIVSGKVNGVAHYWNKLEDGLEIDLTSDQFGGNGLYPVNGAKGRVVPERKRPNSRFDIFVGRLESLWTVSTFIRNFTYLH